MNMPRVAQALENSPEGSHRLPPELAGENRAVAVRAGAGGDSAVCCWVTRWQLCGLAGVPLGPVSSGKRSSLRQMYLNCSEFLGSCQRLELQTVLCIFHFLQLVKLRARNLFCFLFSLALCNFSVTLLVLLVFSVFKFFLRGSIGF